MSSQNTSLLIDKEIHSFAKVKAKKDNLSVSAVARFLLKAYAEGRINIQADIPRFNDLDFKEVQKSDLSSDLQKLADTSYSKSEDEFVNI